MKQSLIPGPSWGHTAGAAYLDIPAYGSPTLGGYDKLRFDASLVLKDVAFGPDISRDFVVQLLSVSYDSQGTGPTGSLLTDSIPIFIDSMITPMWLPVSVCEEFERAFNLTWNDTASLYLVNETVHTALVTQNPTFQFIISSPSDSSGASIAIGIPYAAFDLNASAPLYPSGSRYFPLQRAQNSTQYTLGCAFLQAAYVIANYDTQKFSIAQALYPTD